jgi:hypothetical protein
MKNSMDLQVISRQEVKDIKPDKFYDWLVIKPAAKANNVETPIHKFMLNGVDFIVVSQHMTKGAADKSLRKLLKESSLPEICKDYSYKLSLTEAQARIIIDALDLFSRIGMGQLYEIAHVLRTNVIGSQTNLSDRLDAIDKLTREASACWMDCAGGYYGITSNNISDVYRIAWDLQQVIRYRLAWDKNPNGGIQVQFDRPLKSSNEPLAIIKKI